MRRHSRFFCALLVVGDFVNLPAMDKLTAEHVRYRLSYDPETGIFRWRNPNAKSPVNAGDVAGTLTKAGYIIICVDRIYVMAHRLAWLFVTGDWPINEIDHRDTDGSNNRWRNLRPATSTQNKGNTSLRRDNTSGFKGVAFHKRKGRFAAHIRVSGRSVHLGYFDDPIEAHQAYQEAASRYFGEFARAA